MRRLAVLVSGYVFFGILFEEHDMSQAIGEDYERYRRATPKLIPRFKRKSHA